jgi:nucleotide-binding universal stress UspA family protein
MATTPGPFHRILVPPDFSAASEEAWGTAQRLARPLGAELMLLHVFVEAPLYSESPFSGHRVHEIYESARDWVQTTLARWASDPRASGLTVRTQCRTGVPHREIVAAAGEGKADLIVVGTHGRGGVERALMGSVADRVIRLAPCPVLSVRPVGSP